MRKISLLGQSALGSAVLIGALAFANPAWAQSTVQPGQRPTQEPAEEVSTTNQEQAEAEAGEACPPSADGTRDTDCVPTPDGTGQSGESIVVTGSRIRLPNLESNEPIITVDKNQIQERTFTNVADALNELPIFRGSVTPAGAQGTFGQGVNFVNQYGLGSNRTLTLINGRRFVSSNTTSNFGNASAGTQVDLNVVPTILVERGDNIGVGGAPVYGSDAIAGVANIILRTQFRGIEVSGVSGITEEGDNFRWNGSILAGGDLFGDRLNLTFAYSHDEVEGLVNNDRAFLRENIGGVSNISQAEANARRLPGVGTNDGRVNPNTPFNATNTDLIPPTILARNVRIPFLTRGGVISNTNLSGPSTLLRPGTGTGPTNPPIFDPNPAFCTNPADPSTCFAATGSGVPTTRALQFDGSGNLVPFNQGILFRGTSNAGGDGFAFNDFGQITSDLVRDSAFGFITFKLTPEIELFSEGTYFRSQADELVQQPTFNSSLFGGNSAALNFSVNNPLLTDQARNALIARGVTTFQVSRASLDLADLTGENETEIYRGVVGVRGDFNLFNRDFNFEVSYNYGETESRDTRQDVNAQNFTNAVNVTRNAAGQIVCTTAQTRTGGNGFALGTPIADPACVPLDVFGEGRASAAARAYVIDESTSVSTNEQTVVNANFGGSFFDIWGGAVAFNAGYEYRKEVGSFTPSEFARLGRGRSVPIVGIAGEFELNEVFGELLVPIVSPETGLDWLYGLQVFGRGRYVDNSLAGGFFSWAAGGSIAPVRDIEFRGNFTRSFRAPAIQELFQPVVPAFSTVPDLCSVANRNAGAVPTVRARNCDAFLARFPNATPDPAGTATVPILSGGNPDLQNEIADSYTVGVILRPTFIPRLSLTFDWISITIKQPIGVLSVAGIAGGCFDNEDFNLADPANGNAFCSRIRRDANGRVVNDPANPAVQAGFINGQEVRFRGLQAVLNYSVPQVLGLPGTFTVGADGLYVHRRLNNFSGVAPARSDGTIGDPELSGQLRLRYVEEQWGMNTTINYVHDQVFSRFNREDGQPGQGQDAREFDKLDPYAIVSGSVFFDPTEDFRLTLAVTNAFNFIGQEYFGAIIPASLVDTLGRRYSVSARLRF